jgi:hypothetical protein
MAESIVAIMGSARAGKDTTAEYLVKNHRFTRIGLADPMKRFCKEVFAFTDEQLYGDLRDEPDGRYQRGVAPHDWQLGADGVPDAWAFNHPDAFTCSRCGVVQEGYDRQTPPIPSKLAPESNFCPTFLTPRFALQTLGTEWGRGCYDNVWIEYGIRMAQELIKGYSRYDMKTGLEVTEKDTGICPGVVFSDLRFQNEFDAMRRAGAIMVRIYREAATAVDGVKNHASEEEQKSISDDDFDVVLYNNGSFEELYQQIDRLLIPRL